MTAVILIKFFLEKIKFLSINQGGNNTGAGTEA